MQSGPRLRAGLELGGRYRLEARIGQGGMGEVWRGTDLRLRRPAAVKVLPADLAADEAGVARFRREAEVAASLQHPGITVVFDIDEHPAGGGGVVFLVMELLEGQDLRSLLTRHPNGLPVGQVVALAAQVAEALAAAHSRGIVHRDIKPANLFLLADGRVKICDFGIAQLADATTRLTATGGSIGTPRYMAPEQFRGEPLDRRTDLYSLGCVMYELLTGATPFNADTGPAALMYQHLGQAPAPPAAGRPEIPAAVERLVLDLLAKPPDDRPQSASAVVASLRGTAVPVEAATTVTQQAGAADAGVAETIAEPRPRRARRRALVAVLAAVTGVIAVAAGIFVLADDSGDPSSDKTIGPSAAPRTSGSNAGPLVPGWQAVLAPGYGVAYDVPPNWKVDDPGTFHGFSDDRGQGLAGQKATADLTQGKCTRVRAGLHGGKDPVPNPSDLELDALGGRAAEQALTWAKAAYSARTGGPPVVDTKVSKTVTINGIKTGQATAAVTVTAKRDACLPPRAVVRTVAMAASKGGSVYGPIVFVVYADRGVTPQAGAAAVRDDVLAKIIGSLRPYACPAGLTSIAGRCAPPTASPTGTPSP